MQTLKIDANKAKQLYPNASAEFKAMLEDSFTKDFFSQKITDRVKTLDDACRVLGISQFSLLPSITNNGLEDDTDSIQAYCKLIIIARALNEGWVPDWSDNNQYKYFPWFDEKEPGFGLSCSVYVSWRTGATVGSRLCYKTMELAEYAGKQFNDIYNQYLSLK